LEGLLLGGHQSDRLAVKERQKMDAALDRAICSKEWKALWEKGIFPRGYSPEGQALVDSSLYHLANELQGIPRGALPMARYIAKPDTWFDEGTESHLLFEVGGEPPCGLFRGTRKGEIDEEVCNFEEFETVDEA